MKQILIVILLSFIFFGCKKENEIAARDTTPPPPPQGIRTISLDHAVDIQWLPSQANDVHGYNVWVSDRYDGRYTLIAATSETHLVDHGADNGVTYYYAVSAYDFDDNESALSKDVVYDTPRPEGYGVVLADTNTSKNTSGYSFSQYSVLRYNDDRADFFFVTIGISHYLYVWSKTDIQDMGYTATLDEISSSPTKGWAPSGSAEAIVGHTYVIWTEEEHYAKVRVIEVGAARIVFDWAYQTAQGNTELKVVQRPAAGRKIPKPI